MIYNIGFNMVHVGGRLCEKGGFYDKNNRYEDLTVSGKLGYKLFCAGMAIMSYAKNLSK